MYLAGKLSAEGLREMAPLIAAAEEKRVAATGQANEATPTVPLVGKREDAQR